MEQEILERFAQSTMNVLIFGILIGSLFSIATLAIFDAIKLLRAKCSSSCSTAEAKPAAKAVAKPATKKPAAKKSAAKKKK